jgi:hypothetical protein
MGCFSKAWGRPEVPRNRIGSWLARLSDPRGINVGWEVVPFAVDDNRGLDRLFFEARRHSVHFVFLARFADLLRAEPASVICGNGIDHAAGQLIRRVSDMRLQELARVMAIALAAREVEKAIAGLPVALVKGLDFAEVLFGGISNRSFGDIDLLYDPRVETELRERLIRLGFSEHRPDLHPGHYAERQWIRPHPHMGQILLELHADMVHVEDLRRRVSLPYGRYVDGRGEVTPAARLILAAVHAATSHLFGRLQYVVDGLMAARAGVDAAELRERGREAGAVIPLRTLLRLAATIFSSDDARILLDALPAPRGSKLESKLIPGSMVLAAKSRSRWRFIPQRRLYRRLIME